LRDQFSGWPKSFFKKGPNRKTSKKARVEAEVGKIRRPASPPELGAKNENDVGGHRRGKKGVLFTRGEMGKTTLWGKKGGWGGGPWGKKPGGESPSIHTTEKEKSREEKQKVFKRKLSGAQNNIRRNQK